MPDEDVTEAAAAADSGEGDAVTDGASPSLEQPSALSNLLDSYFAQRSAQSASTFAEAADRYLERNRARQVALEDFLDGNGPAPWEGRR